MLSPRAAHSDGKTETAAGASKMRSASRSTYAEDTSLRSPAHSWRRAAASTATASSASASRRQLASPPRWL